MNKNDSPILENSLIVGASKPEKLLERTKMTVDALPPSSARAIESNANKLVQLPSGEYTALSVSANYSDAAKLGLVKAKDGNYVRPPIVPSPAYASVQSTSGVQAALTTLPLGGK